MRKIALTLLAAGFPVVTLLWGFSSLISPATARTVDGLDNGEISSLYHYLAGKPINFEKKARDSNEYRSADEFDKSAILKQIIADLREQHQSISQVDLIRIRARARISKYNSDIGAYQFSVFKPGTYFRARGQSSGYSVLLDNASEFLNWALPVPAAKAVRNETPYGDVTIELEVRPFGIHPSRSQSIRGQIVGIKVFMPETNRLAYQTHIDASQYHPIQTPERSLAETPIDPERMTLQGLRVGIPRNSIEDWAIAAGYHSYFFGPKAIFSEMSIIATNEELFELNLFGLLAARRKEHSIFGRHLNCHSKTDRLESCGIIRADKDNIITSVVIMQPVVGITREQLIQSLLAKYGPPADSFNVHIHRDFEPDAFTAKQLVWGISSADVEGSAYEITNLSRSKHWQVEAVITQPKPDRLVLFVQLNNIPRSESVDGVGRIKL